jgi:predicted site-specific integrase-resolvase
MSHPGVTGRKSGQFSNPDPILTEAEMAERLRVSIFTLRRWRKQGKIAFIQLTQRTIGYRQSFGDRLIDAHTIQSTAA